jgi:lambda family phage portal protein
MGVEINAVGKPVVYHVWKYHPAEGGREHSSNERVPIPAEDIVHLFLIERPGQCRGMPWFAPVLRNLKHLDDWRENAVVAARIGAAKMGFFVDKEGLGAGGQNDETDGTGTAPDRLKMDIEAGMFGELPPGYEFQSFDPGYPNIEYEAFERAILRAISAGLGVSYSALTGDLREVNYSSDRSGRIAERDLYRTLHGYLIEKLCQPIYGDWLNAATARQAIRPPTYDLDLLEQSAVWQGRGWQWVDPRADVLSIKEQIALGLFSRTAACTEMGRDFQDIVEQLKAEQAFAAEQGVSVAGLTSQGDSAQGGSNDGSSGTDGSAGGDAQSNGRADPSVRLVRHA